MILRRVLSDMLRTFFGSRKRAASDRRGADDVSAALPILPKGDPSRVPSFFLPMFWGTLDADKVTELMKAATALLMPGSHFADNLLTWGRNMSMLDDAPFVAAWQANAESDADKAVVWRRYVLASAAYHCVQLDGDFVECGAYTGVGIKTVLDYLGGPSFPRTFWGYDVFEHGDSMLNHPMPEHGPELYERVRKKFAGYPQMRLLKGLIPEVFAEGCPLRIAYLHIDLNQADAEIAALDHLFDRMVPGGLLILDDYEWGGVYRPQKIAEDAWFQQRNYRVMPLPTGQGLIIKR